MHGVRVPANTRTAVLQLGYSYSSDHETSLSTKVGVHHSCVHTEMGGTTPTDAFDGVTLEVGVQVHSDALSANARCAVLDSRNNEFFFDADSQGPSM